MQISFEQSDVTIHDLPAVPVAIVKHRGDRSGLAETIRRFREWRTAAGIKPEASSTFMLFRSERSPQNPADYSVDICAETREPFVSDGSVEAGVIPAGRCAVLRYPGNTNNLEPAFQFLYQDWLPASGEEPRDLPSYSRRRLSFIPEVSAHEVIVEAFLPLK